MLAAGSKGRRDSKSCSPRGGDLVSAAWMAVAIVATLAGCRAFDAPIDETAQLVTPELSGWHGDFEQWSVGGATGGNTTITGRIAPGSNAPQTIVGPIEVRDFYFAAEMRLTPASARGAIYFRTRPTSTGELRGYLVELGEARRGALSHSSREVASSTGVRGSGWSRIEILAVGNRLWTAVDGRLAAIVLDPGGERSGPIALRLEGSAGAELQARRLVLVRNPTLELAGLGSAELERQLRVTVEKEALD